MSLSGWMRGLTFVFLWYFSILIGFFFLCCPLLPLMFLHNVWYRRILDVIFAVWEMYPVALMELLFGTRVVVSGDVIRPWDKSLIVMNHRTRLDWNFLWAGMFHGTRPAAHRLKIVLKSGIRHFPGPGWVMQMACFLYIHRHWEQDQKLLARVLDYFRDIDHTCQILIFPEGTDLTPQSKKRSNDYAASKHLERYEHVLHPKTTGFVFLTQRMRQNKQLDAIYDITVGYPRTLPQNEMDILRGNIPEEVHFHIKRHAVSTLPDTDVELQHWLSELWSDKEEILHQFYSAGRFVHVLSSDTLVDLPTPPNNALYLALISWTILTVAGLYGLATSLTMQIWIAIHSLIFIVLSFCSEGIHHVEIHLREMISINAKRKQI